MASPFATVLGAALAAAGTMAFFTQVDSLITQRQADCATGVLISYYIAYSAAGSGTGGSGTGSFGSPYLCRHWKDVCDLLAMLDAPDSAVYFRRGDTFDGRGGAATMTVTSGNFFIGNYGTGDAPVLTDFTPENTLVAGGWTAGGSGEYTKTFTGISITWVRKDEAPSVNLIPGTETAFTKYGSAAAVVASTGVDAWYQDPATKVVTIKLAAGGSPAGIVQMSRSLVYGIHTTGANVMLQGLTVLGFGIQESDNGQSNLFLEISGTNTVSVVDCNLYYSCAHVAQAYQATAAATGGYSLFKNVKCGYCLRPYSGAYGTPVMLNHYNGGAGAGQHEVYYDGCTAQYGALPYPISADMGHGVTAFAPRCGYLFYSHTNGVTKASLAIARNCTTKNHTYGCQYNSTFRDLPAPSNHCAVTEYRGYIINETHEGGTGALLQLNYNSIVRINDDLTAAPSNTAPYTWGTGNGYGFFDSSNPVTFIAIQPRWKVDLTALPGAGNVYGFRNGSNQADKVLVLHGHLQATCNGNNFCFDTNDSAGCSTKGWRLFNTIISEISDANAYHSQYSKNQAAGVEASDTYTGGSSNCAYWNPGTTMATSDFPTPGAPGSGGGVGGAYWGMDSTGSPVTLSQQPTVGAVPSTTSQLYQVGANSFPIACDVWIDSTRTVRQMPSRRSIGPVQPTSTTRISRIARSSRHNRVARV